MFDAIIAMPDPEASRRLADAVARMGAPVAIVGQFEGGLDFLGRVRVRPPDIAFVDLNLDGSETHRTLCEFRFFCPRGAWIGLCDPGGFAFSLVAKAMELRMCGLLLLPPGDANLAEALDAALSELSRNEMLGALTRPPSVPDGEIDSGLSAELAERMYQFIVHNHVEPLTMADLINTFFISESYVNRVLMKHKRKSFKKILTEVRIQHAKELMNANPLLSIGEIAHAVGYGDSHYFSRVYKAFTGLSPSYYRDASVDQEEEPWRM